MISVEDNSYEQKYKLKQWKKCLISEEMEIKMLVSFTYQISETNFNNKQRQMCWQDFREQTGRQVAVNIDVLCL